MKTKSKSEYQPEGDFLYVNCRLEEVGGVYIGVLKKDLNGKHYSNKKSKK